MSITKADVENAIRAVLTAGQEYTLPDGRRVRQADLPDLVQLRDRLAQEESVTGSAVSRIVFRRE